MGAKPDTISLGNIQMQHADTLAWEIALPGFGDFCKLVDYALRASAGLDICLSCELKLNPNDMTRLDPVGVKGQGLEGTEVHRIVAIE